MTDSSFLPREGQELGPRSVITMQGLDHCDWACFPSNILPSESLLQWLTHGSAFVRSPDLKKKKKTDMFYLLYIQRRKGPSIPHPNKYLKHMHSLRAHGGHSFIHSEKRYSKAVWLLSIVRAYCHLVAKLCLTLATPWTVAHQAPLSMEFSKQEYWSGLPCPPPGDLLNPGTEPTSPASQADYLPLSHQGRPTEGLLCARYCAGCFLYI